MVEEYGYYGVVKEDKEMKHTYIELFNYYQRCMMFIDCLHFNSNHTRECYERHMNYNEGVVVPITHGGIKDNRRYKEFNPNFLKIGFIGSVTSYKGLPLLIEVLQKIGDNGKWSLEVWGNSSESNSGLPISYRGKFRPVDMETVYASMDILVVPSQCHETFSLVALEALSYGVPVLVSSTVGAKDIVKQYDPHFVFSTKQDLEAIVVELIADKLHLVDYNKKIMQYPWVHDMRHHTQELLEKVYKFITEK